MQIEKHAPIRHGGYRRLVAQYPCIHCGIYGYSQAAHPNTGKGMATKADDNLCFPLCTVHPGPGGNLVQGCHELLDQHALYGKEDRRRLEGEWALSTAARITADGLWPQGLRYPRALDGQNRETVTQHHGAAKP